ncbi:MAG: hypothetical protein AAGA70_07085 [Pseudomonadota bacterium]
MNVICSNMDALNADFVMLLARHLDFEPNVLLNPSRQQVVNLGTLAAVRFVVSGNDFNSILECGDRIGVDANRLEQEVFRLRSRLSSEAVLAYTGEPTGRVVTAGEELEISGQHIFVSVSDIDDLMAAGSAVAYLHGANHLSCWFDPACSAEAEAHWAGRSD